jgi:hypothetical protein
MNKFKLQLPENGFGYPCNICANRDLPVSKCKGCSGYDGVDFPIDQAVRQQTIEECKVLVEKWGNRPMTPMGLSSELLTILDALKERL